MQFVAHPDPGLCARCVHAGVVASDRGSTFLRCGLADSDPRFPKYPRLPVLACDGWKPEAGRDRKGP